MLAIAGAVSDTYRKGRLAGARLGVLRPRGTILSTAVITLSIVIVLLLVRDTNPATLHSWADAGQALGAVSAIVSTAALIALIVTFAAQQHELKGHRRELRVQAESLASARHELRC